MDIRCFITFFAAVSCLCHKVQAGDPHSKNATEDLVIAVGQNDYLKARDAIARNADINWRDGSLETPLHMAARAGYVEVMTVLLVAGADKEGRNNAYFHPLNLAAIYGREDATVVLAAAGADLHAEDGYGMTPLLEAGDENFPALADFLRTLLYYSLKKPMTTNEPATRALFEALEKNDHAGVAQAIESGADIDKLERGTTPLCRAALLGHIQTMGVLLRAGANPEVADKDGDRPLHSAALGGHNSAVAVMAVAGADLHAPGRDGQTPLQRAANETAPFLRSLGAS